MKQGKNILKRRKKMIRQRQRKVRLNTNNAKGHTRKNECKH